MNKMRNGAIVRGNPAVPASCNSMRCIYIQTNPRHWRWYSIHYLIQFPL